MDAKGLSGQGGLDELNGLYGAQACIEFGVSNADSFGVGDCCDTARWLNVGSASGSDAQVWINLLDGDLVFKRVGGPSFNVNIKDGKHYTMKAYAEHISSGTADELSGLTLVGMQTLVGDADNGGFVNFDLELEGGAKSFVFSPSDAEGNYVAGSNVSVNSLSFVTEEGEAGGPGPVVADCEPGETAISFGLGETVVDLSLIHI